MRITSLVLLIITRLPAWAKMRIASLFLAYVVKLCINAGPAPLARVTSSIWMNYEAVVPTCVSGDKELAHVSGGRYVCTYVSIGSRVVSGGVGRRTYGLG